jgi:hypothetical protein
LGETELGALLLLEERQGVDCADSGTNVSDIKKHRENDDRHASVPDNIAPIQNEQIGRKGLDEVDGGLHDTKHRGHIEVIKVCALIRLAALVGHVETNSVNEFVPSDEDKKSGRDQDQTDVPARSSSPFADKDLDATDEENEVYPIEHGLDAQSDEL